MKNIIISIFIGLLFVGCNTNENESQKTEENQSNVEVIDVLSKIDNLKNELDGFNVGRFAAGELTGEKMKPINEMRADYDEIDGFFKEEILPKLNSGKKYDLSELPEEYNLEYIISNCKLTYENKLIQIKLQLLENIIQAMHH